MSVYGNYKPNYDLKSEYDKAMSSLINYRRDLHKLLPDNCTVAELGVAEGYNSSDMCQWTNLGRLYCVDAWQTLNVFGDGGYNQEWHDKNYDAALKRLLPYSGKITILRGVTYKMAAKVEDNSLDLLYLDADHSYEGVTKDLEAWYGKVKPGGVIAGHDYISYRSVEKAVSDFSNKVKVVVYVIPEDKAEDAGFFFIKP